MMRRLLADDRGITLTEMVVAMMVSAIVMTATVVWLSAVLRTDEAQADRLDSIEELRKAKGQITRELRFAKEVIDPPATDDAITFWLDGGTKDLKEPGEMITYILVGDELHRITDAVPPETHIIATGLQASGTSMVLTDDTVDLTFTVDLDPGDDLPSRSIQTSITARNT